MIASLSGIVEQRFDPYIILAVNGVGYKVLASQEVLKMAGEIGSTIKIFTYTHVKEDALELYGFSNHSDLTLFEMLLSVSGVGPKTAVSIFSIGSSREIQQAITLGNVDYFTSVPRLGRKNAQKIIIELKNKLGSKVDLDLSNQEAEDNKDIIAALRTFGYSTKEAADIIKQLDKTLKPEEKIRQALKSLGK